AFGDVGVLVAERVDDELVVGALAEDLRAARTEVGEAGDPLLGGEGRGLVEVQGGHGCSFELGGSFAVDSFPPAGLGRTRANPGPGQGPGGQPSRLPAAPLPGPGHHSAPGARDGTAWRPRTWLRSNSASRVWRPRAKAARVLAWASGAWTPEPN